MSTLFDLHCQEHEVAVEEQERARIHFNGGLSAAIAILKSRENKGPETLATYNGNKALRYAGIAIEKEGLA